MFRLAFVADARPETGSSLRPYRTLIDRRGPRFRKAGPKSEGLTPKPIGLSRNSPTEPRYDIRATYPPCVALPAPHGGARPAGRRRKLTANDIDVSGRWRQRSRISALGRVRGKVRALGGSAAQPHETTERKADGSCGRPCEGDATHAKTFGRCRHSTRQ